MLLRFVLKMHIIVQKLTFGPLLVFLPSSLQDDQYFQGKQIWISLLLFAINYCQRQKTINKKWTSNSQRKKNGQGLQLYSIAFIRVESQGLLLQVDNEVWEVFRIFLNFCHPQLKMLSLMKRYCHF